MVSAGLAGVLAAAWLGPCVAASSLQDDGRISEYELKAAVLYNFFRFIQWPPQSFASDTSPYVVCVVGNDPFGDSLAGTFAGKRVDGRPFNVVERESRSPVSSCHLAFISASEERNVSAILKPLERAPTLTVADFSAFDSSGGMITLFTESSRVRFSINEGAVHRAGLHVSSLLLNLARPPARAER